MLPDTALCVRLKPLDMCGVELLLGVPRLSQLSETVNMIAWSPPSVEPS